MKTISRMLIAIIAVSLLYGVALAAFTGPFYDTFVVINETNNSAAPNLSVQDSTSSCTDTHISYIQFDATGIGTVDTATLTLTVGGTPVGLDTNPVITLYGVGDFDPSSLNGTNYPTTASGAPIQVKTIPSTAAAGYVVDWGGADSGLKDYIQSQADGDNTVTLALSFSGNCHAVNSSLSFYSQDWGTEADRPALNVTGTTPTAVTLDFLSSTTASSPWTRYALLFVLIGLVSILTVRLRGK